MRLLALTVATDETDGYKRFMKSAKANRIDVKVFFNYLFASIMACGSIQRAFCFGSPFVRTADFVIVSLPSLFVNVLCVTIVLHFFFFVVLMEQVLGFLKSNSVCAVTILSFPCVKIVS